MFNISLTAACSIIRADMLCNQSLHRWSKHSTLNTPPWHMTSSALSNAWRHPVYPLKNNRKHTNNTQKKLNYPQFSAPFLASQAISVCRCIRKSLVIWARHKHHTGITVNRQDSHTRLSAGHSMHPTWEIRNHLSISIILVLLLYRT